MESSYSSTHDVHAANAAAPELFHSPVPYMILYHPCQSTRDSVRFCSRSPGSLQRIPLTGQQAEQLKHRSSISTIFWKSCLFSPERFIRRLKKPCISATQGNAIFSTGASATGKKFPPAASPGPDDFPGFSDAADRHDAQHAPSIPASVSFEPSAVCLNRLIGISPVPQKNMRFILLFPLSTPAHRFLHPGRISHPVPSDDRRNPLPETGEHTCDGRSDHALFSMLEMPGLYRKSLIRLACTKEELLVNKITYIFEACHGIPDGKNWRFC